MQLHRYHYIVIIVKHLQSKSLIGDSSLVFSPPSILKEALSLNDAFSMPASPLYPRVSSIKIIVRLADPQIRNKATGNYLSIIPYHHDNDKSWETCLSQTTSSSVCKRGNQKKVSFNLTMCFHLFKMLPAETWFFSREGRRVSWTMPSYAISQWPIQQTQRTSRLLCNSYFCRDKIDVFHLKQRLTSPHSTAQRWARVQFVLFCLVLLESPWYQEPPLITEYGGYLARQITAGNEESL